MTSYGPLTSSVMWPYEAAHATSYRSSIMTKPVPRVVFEIFSFENFYFITSPLTSRCPDRLSVWIVWAHYAVDDYVKRWSNSDKNCWRRSILKSWRHDYDVIGSRDVIGDVTIRLPLPAFLYAPNSNRPPISLICRLANRPVFPGMSRILACSYLLLSIPRVILISSTK